MNDDPSAVERIEALLTEAERAHGRYEQAELNGVYDEAWPRWYAGYVVEHGIGSILGSDVGADQVTGVLERSWSELQAADPKPAGGWSAFAARMLADDLGAP